MSGTNTLRQIGLMVGLVASVVIGAAVVLWLWTPGSDDYFGSNSAVYNSPSIQGERIRLETQLEYLGNNRFSSVNSSNDNGRLLTHSGSQLEYTQKLEASYTQRIERLLEPLLGAGAIRAQVTADIDFTAREQTLETYNPDSLVLRNKELEEKIKDREVDDKPGVFNKYRREVNSYEIGKTINHTRSAIGRIAKLSIAVIVDDKFSRGVKGNAIRTPHTEGELNKLADLVKKAVGFNADRGDIVDIIGASFKASRSLNVHPQKNSLVSPTWGQVWVKDLFDKTLAILLVLLLIFTVIRPAIKSLVSFPEHIVNNSGAISTISGSGISEDDDSGDYKKNMDKAIRVVKDDPKLVAQIMKNWVSADGA